MPITDVAGTAVASAGSQSIDRAVAILDILRTSPDGLGVNALARQISLPPPTAHRLLRALTHHGLVQQHPVSRTYSLGWKLVDYATAVMDNTHLATISTDIVKRLRDSSAESAALQARVGHDRVCLVEFESPHDLRRTLGVGRRIPLHAGSSGRAILAFLTPDELRTLLQESPPLATPNYAVLDLDTMHRLLDETRKTGIARSEPIEEEVAGIAALSTPFFLSDGSIGGALSISGPSGRWTRAVMSRHVDSLRMAGEELSRRLGYHKPFPWCPAQSE